MKVVLLKVSWDIQGDQREGKSGVTKSVIDEFYSWISNEIKWKVKVVLLEVSLMNVIFGYPSRSNVR